MTHANTEVVVPVGAVQCVATVGEVLCPGDIRNDPALALGAAGHRLARIAVECLEGADRCIESITTGAHVSTGDQRGALVDPHVLRTEIDLDPAIGNRCWLTFRGQRADGGDNPHALGRPR